MTRFARADGSKASNKRTYEEATPWEEMKEDMQSIKKHTKKKKLQDKKNKDISNVKENNGIQLSSIIESVAESFESTEKKKVLKNSNSSSELEVPFCENKEPSKIKKEKKKKDLKSSNPTSEPELPSSETKSNQNEKSESKKKDKKKKKVKTSTPDVESEQLSGKEIHSDKTEKGTKKKKKEMSLEEKKKKFVIENGVKYKIFKNGKKKPWFDLPYEENDVMTRYNTYYVKHEEVTKINQLRESLENEGSLDKKQISNKVLHAERNAHNKLRLELLRAQINEGNDSSNQDISLSKNIKRNFHRKLKVFDSPKSDNKTENRFPKPNKGRVQLNYEENEIMTEFDGYWMLRENLKGLQNINNKKIKRIIHERADGNTNENLTAEEELTHRRLMKKEKRREMRLLKLKLIEIGIPETKQWKKKNQKPGRYLGINYEEDEKMVKFGGFYVKKDAAERLTTLRETMITKGCTEEEIWPALKAERRKEERALKNENKLFCYKCRMVGHMVSACPQMTEGGNEGGVELCYRCGSTEHMARNCSKNKSGSYTHATCFICNEMGHISRECPDNPRGLYPNGGCCNECGSVEHLKRDCPELQEKYEDNTLKASRFHEGQAIDALDEEATADDDGEEPQKPSRKKAKIIKFD